MKIILIAQHIFPMQSPRANRATELARELAKRGHEIVLYASIGSYDYSSFSQETGITVKNIPLRYQIKPITSDGYRKRTLVDKVLSQLLGKRFQFPVNEYVPRIAKLFKNETADAVISIANPHQIHWGVARGKAKYAENFPNIWIADCGDPFMMNGKAPFGEKYEELEKDMCQKCDYITVPIEAAKEEYYPQYRDKIEVIPQGFNMQDLSLAAYQKNEVPTFAYAGSFYQDIRNPKQLFEILMTISEPFRFVLYSQNAFVVDKYVQLLGDKIEVRRTLPREQLLFELSKMDFLVNIENLNSPGQLPSKLIDYAITGRPILSVHPEKVNGEKLRSFLQGDYSGAEKIVNFEQYDIVNVAGQFESLVNRK